MKSFSLTTLTLAVAASSLSAEQPADHLVFKGDPSLPGQNKHVVLIAGDEEYRSEEAMPMLAQILAKQGFQCTVLFSMDKENKFVDPLNHKSLSYPEALDSADALVLGIRFRNWPDATNEKFMATFERGVPVLGLRTTTHGFKIKGGSDYAFLNFNSKSKKMRGGFGKQVLGETWVSHWGKHAFQGTRTIAEEANKQHPVLNGVESIFCKSDIYEAKPLDPSTILLRGQITESLESDSAIVTEGKGATLQPVAWTRNYKHENGNESKIVTTTMGSADDLLDDNLRRLVVNGVFWGLELPVPEKADVSFVTAYNPTMFGTKTFPAIPNDPRVPYVKGRTPSDLITLEKGE
ncbi:ThuA domain-containing protein [Rubritalea sp.]|uniref:ThuA domain-containing protein n=1 Tax=Rubritalea sp. TaxID=2109375 RepID=UPI003EF87E0B